MGRTSWNSFARQLLECKIVTINPRFIIGDYIVQIVRALSATSSIKYWHTSMQMSFFFFFVAVRVKIQNPSHAFTRKTEFGYKKSMRASYENVEKRSKLSRS